MRVLLTGAAGYLGQAVGRALLLAGHEVVGVAHNELGRKVLAAGGMSSMHQVGSRLLSETDRVKVWQIRVGPGERLPAHRHVLDYFWTALTDGSSIQHIDDGTTRSVSYRAGDTRHFTFPGDSYLLHDLCNVGSTELAFITVEHKR